MKRIDTDCDAGAIALWNEGSPTLLISHGSGDGGSVVKIYDPHELRHTHEKCNTAWILETPPSGIMISSHDCHREPGGRLDAGCYRVFQEPREAHETGLLLVREDVPKQPHCKVGCAGWTLHDTAGYTCIAAMGSNGHTGGPWPTCNGDPATMSARRDGQSAPIMIEDPHGHQWPTEWDRHDHMGLTCTSSPDEHPDIWKIWKITMNDKTEFVRALDAKSAMAQCRWRYHASAWGPMHATRIEHPREHLPTR